MNPAFVLIVAAALLLVSSTAAAVPPCVEHCKKMSETGELRDGISVTGCEVRVCQREARTFYETNEFQKSLESLDYLAERLKESPSYQMDRGLALYALDRFPEALAEFEKILKGFPGNVRAGAQRGHTLVRLGRYSTADEQFRKLLENPSAKGEFKNLRTESYLRGNVGVIHLLRNQVPEGKKELQDALGVDGRNQLAGTYLYKVVPYMESGDLDYKGVQLLLLAFENLGLKRFTDAAKDLQKLLARSPKYAPGYHRLAEILASYHQYDACAIALEVGEKHLPQDIDLQAERLRCVLLHFGVASDKGDLALRELRQLASAHPENKRLRAMIAALEEP